jgi:acyl-coenzyme A synthetase/AMP-(fatty) acid ligase
MLACTRLGAPHSVVFGGFSADALRDRIQDTQCRVVITADEVGTTTTTTTTTASPHVLLLLLLA